MIEFLYRFVMIINNKLSLTAGDFRAWNFPP